ncbi:DUF896 domain-containing protein [Mycoplasmatota bacterium]|nr:DUF896 domain-containing protein [Mycoplasmatota bacterium]
MLSKEKMIRLKELANKAKKEGLTDNEKVEQKKLRDEYLTVFRKHFRKRLDNVVFVDEKGNEIKKPIQ